MTALSIGELTKLETKVWDALVAGDSAADEAMLSDDFLGVYTTGFANRAEHTGELADGPTVVSYELSEKRLFAVADSAVMFCYRADYTRPSPTSEPVADAMYISSLWCKRDGVWINTFSQDTPTPAEQDH